MSRNPIYILVLCLWGFMVLSSCENENSAPEEEIPPVIKEEKRISSILISGQEGTTFILKYDDQNRLDTLIEKNGEEVTSVLTYSGREVIMKRAGKYYGKYILNDQGYAASFERDYTRTCYYEYSEKGYLIRSDDQETETVYTYTENNTLSGIFSGNNEFRIDYTGTKDKLSVPAFYHPQYLHISGNVEVQIGWLAGLYGKTGNYLPETSRFMVGKDAAWGYEIFISYEYELDEEGYVLKQQEKIQGHNDVGELTFTYE